MTIGKSVIGIDVSKHHLDVFDDATGRHERFANEPTALMAWVAGLAGREVTIIFEATGDYDAALRAALDRAGLAYGRVNPAKARAFAKAAGFLAKTDKVDARMLAALGKALPQAPAAPVTEARRRLTALNRRRDQLVAMRQQEKARLSETPAQDEDLRADLAGHIAELTARIRQLEADIARFLAATAELNAQAKLMRSVPGIGPVAATTLLALMPELGDRSAKSIAALAGLAPLNDDSGKHRGNRAIGEGRRRVRRALFMAALYAARSASRFGTFHAALRAKGKKPKVALIAVARKLLVTLNAILRTGIPFHA